MVAVENAASIVANKYQADPIKEMMRRGMSELTGGTWAESWRQFFQPGDVTNSCDFNHFWSPHQNGANFLFADGSVHFLPYSARPIMKALATRSGGEVVDLSKY